MDYEKKYKDALANARQEYTTTENVERKQWLEELFPELKKSKNERIKKRILLSLEKDLMATKNNGCDTQDLEQCIAWLEKQSEQKTAVVDFNAKDWYVSKVDGKIHDITYNPTDMVEPKFKVGDWITNGRYNRLIVGINSDWPFYMFKDGTSKRIKDIENKYHLWTIQDAKDGDVLVGKIDGDDYILIFKQIKDGWIETYGHYYNAVDRFCVPSQLFCRSYQGTFTLATKEQRDTLMKAMTDAGYEWNAEKKELKLLITNGGDFEQKQEWNDEDDYNLQCMIAKVTYDIQKGNVGRNNELIDWLKSLKERVQPQPKQEWSDEDEFRLSRTVENIELLNDANGNILFKDIEWLKSLKDRLSNVKKNIKTFA